MVSSTNAAYNLTVNNAASGHYALVVMTVASALLVPVILLYQGWSFHVFRARVQTPPARVDSPAPQPAGPGPKPDPVSEPGGVIKWRRS
jgi:cytochrome bd ubiquinol oxidase subunit II